MQRTMPRRARTNSYLEEKQERFFSLLGIRSNTSNVIIQLIKKKFNVLYNDICLMYLCSRQCCTFIYTCWSRQCCTFKGSMQSLATHLLTTLELDFAYMAHQIQNSFAYLCSYLVVWSNTNSFILLVCMLSSCVKFELCEVSYLKSNYLL